MLAVTDIRTPAECISALERLGARVVLLPPLPSLPAPVASHPDMLIFPMGGRLLTHGAYLKIAKEQLQTISEAAGLDLAFIEETAADTYPRDVLLNAARVGDSIIASESAISAHIKQYCADRGVRLINIKQGYAKCSVCVIDDHAIITADRGIARAATSAGIEVLTVTPGHVALPGYDTGFIGGASGSFDDTVCFCGDITTHPDHMAILDFCAVHGKKVVSLGYTPLTDVGTVFFF